MEPPRRYSILVYMEESRRPLVSLVFLLPILLTYEIGIRLINLGRQTPVVNGADAILKQAFQSLGVYGSVLSALTVILTLFLLHLHRSDPWRVRPMTLLGMAAESLVMALPLFLLHYLVNRVLLAGGAEEGWPHLTVAVYALGAGVYEEYLFRLLLIGGVVRLLAGLGRNRQAAQIWTVLAGAVCFAAFHYIGPHGDDWGLRSFAFRTVAGIYFAWLYLSRGFGLAVGCHTAYDLMVVALRL